MSDCREARDDDEEMFATTRFLFFLKCLLRKGFCYFDMFCSLQNGVSFCLLRWYLCRALKTVYISWKLIVANSALCLVISSSAANISQTAAFDGSIDKLLDDDYDDAWLSAPAQAADRSVGVKAVSKASSFLDENEDSELFQVLIVCLLCLRCFPPLSFFFLLIIRVFIVACLFCFFN